jgi:hypothetical protein
MSLSKIRLKVARDHDFLCEAMNSPHRSLLMCGSTKASGRPIVAAVASNASGAARLYILQNDYYNGRTLEIDGGLRL